MGLDTTRAFVPVSIAVMTISDSRTLEDDKSGDLLVARLQEAGHTYQRAPLSQTIKIKSSKP